MFARTSLTTHICRSASTVGAQNVATERAQNPDVDRAIPAVLERAGSSTDRLVASADSGRGKVQYSDRTDARRPSVTA